MAVAIGTRFGPYEILALIGTGGMGEVYKARDTRLDRRVAIKVLREHLADDPDRRARLEREARAISKLNHPHICTLYDVGRDNGTDYLVVEYLEGQTLADRLRKGRLPIDQALAIAIDIADALDAAHRAGIVHRDLKPANIFLVWTGGASAPPTAKLLDFGIARTSTASVSTSLPAETTLTAEGVLVGTVQYMAPEQLEGREADARSDIFAFGAVLYEMLCGRRAFAGDTQAAIAAAVMERDPQPLAAVPPALDRLVRKCLAKDVERRWQTSSDLVDELRWTSTAPPGTARASPRRWTGYLAAAAGVLGISLAIAAAVALYPGQTRDTQVFRHSFVAAADLRNQMPLALSRDGSRLAFTAPNAEGVVVLWIRSLDSLTATPLGGTDGAEAPFWSPDGKALAFFAGGRLKRVDASGGPVLELASAVGVRSTGSWSRNGIILFPNKGALDRVAATGGARSTVLTSADGASALFPSFLPDGRHFLFSMVGQTGGGTFVASLDSSERSRLIDAVTNTQYVGGRLLYMRGTTLVAQRFDTRRLAFAGDAVPVAEHVSVFTPNLGIGAFASSDTGVLAYQDSGPAVGASRLVWLDRKGNKVGELGEREVYAGIFGNSTAEASLSPDGTRASAVVPGPNGRPDIWIFDLGRRVRTRLTFDGASAPVWSPDGQFVAFRSARGDTTALSMKAANGNGDDKLLLADFKGIPESWSPDGRYIVVATLATPGNPDLWVLPLFGDRQLRPFIQSPALENRSQFSPDGRWIAYQSSESGAPAEIFVAPFPGPGGRRQVSLRGGREPRWRRDGKELFYLAGNVLMSASVTTTADRFEVDATTSLFEVPALQRGAAVYDVSHDGMRFLVDVNDDQQTANTITLIMNWPALLKQ